MELLQLPLVVWLALASLLAVGAAAVAPAERADWAEYKRQHGKRYGSAQEDARRFVYYRAANRTAAWKNAANDGANYTSATNFMSDWTRAELDSLRGPTFSALQLARVNSKEASGFLGQLLGRPGAPPNELDWRLEAHRVAPVKSQGRRAGSWAFAAAGALEGQQVARGWTRSLVALSEQQLLDCCIDQCSTPDAFEEVELLGGIEAESSYPYKARKDHCRFELSRAVMGAQDSALLPRSNASALLKVLAAYGPVATGMFVTDLFVQYSGGIFSDHTCWSSRLNHGVLLVGYGSHPEHGDYWIAKNSWSESWGEQGFFRIKRGVNMCGIELQPVIPVVASK